MTLRQRIADADDSGSVSVPMPDWGFRVFVRRLSEAEARRYALARVTGLRALARVLCDEGGFPVYGPEDDAEAVHVLSRKSMSSIARLMDAASAANGHCNAIFRLDFDSTSYS